MTDNKVKTTGACRLNTIDDANRVNFRKGLQMLEKIERLSYILVRACDAVEDLDKFKRYLNN